MTPLAQKIARELTLPVKERTFVDDGRLSVLKHIPGAHCFEVSEVFDLAQDMALQWHQIRDENPDRWIPLDERSSFLPADTTWIEWAVAGHGRYGVLLCDQLDRGGCVGMAVAGDDRYGALMRIALALGRAEDFGRSTLTLPDNSTDKDRATEEYGLSLKLYALLAMINTPRIIGRQQHMPHRGLEKRLAKAMGIQGRFPLQAWTEIKLQITPPQDMTDDGSYEAHLTGQKALHFCRAHLRVRLGRVEVVRGHWRGDASLGIKRSRYVLTH